MQLEMAWQDEDRLRRDIEAQSGVAIDLVITNNTSSIITMRPRRGRFELRLHRMFLHAGPDVVRALGTWLQSGRRRRAGRVIDEFISKHQHQLEAAPRRVRLRTEGEFHDLRVIFDDVNGEHFDGRIDAAITWGRMPSRRPRRSIRFGSYTAQDHLIRMHPLLDQAFVPHYVVRYIVFHEMLHADLGAEESPSGRRRVHTPEFNRIERTYPEFERANEWIESPRNLRKLLSRRAA